MKKLYVVGIGPGSIEDMSLRAAKTIEKCNIIVGYNTYIELIFELIKGKEIVQNGMRKEIERVTAAIELAANPENSVAVISSGDAGVYGMAGLALQLAKGKGVEIEVIPGITASLAAASILGAPLMHDFCQISLSDLLTPYELIEKRVKLAAEGDFVIAVYNPRSRGRSDYLEKMLGHIKQFRSPQTPVGLIKNASRDKQEMILATLEEFDCTQADMLSTVIIGNSNTYISEGRMITPRGYERKMK